MHRRAKSGSDVARVELSRGLPPVAKLDREVTTLPTNRAVTGRRASGPTRAGMVFAFWSMMVFLGVLTVGFIYEWKKGALEWE